MCSRITTTSIDLYGVECVVFTAYRQLFSDIVAELQSEADEEQGQTTLNHVLPLLIPVPNKQVKGVKLKSIFDSCLFYFAEMNSCTLSLSFRGWYW